jgi:hypothetical protein
MKGADVSRGLLSQLAEITQLRRLRIAMSEQKSWSNSNSGDSAAQEKGIGMHCSNSSSHRHAGSILLHTVDQGLTAADLPLLTRLSQLSHLVFKLAPCCKQNRQQLLQQHQSNTDSQAAAQPVAARDSSSSSSSKAAAVAALRHLPSLAVVELGNMGFDLLHMLQLTQLTGLQHMNNTGCCEQCSSSWSVALSTPQLRQVCSNGLCSVFLVFAVRVLRHECDVNCVACRTALQEMLALQYQVLCRVGDVHSSAPTAAQFIEAQCCICFQYKHQVTSMSKLQLYCCCCCCSAGVPHTCFLQAACSTCADCKEACTRAVLQLLAVLAVLSLSN